MDIYSYLNSKDVAEHCRKLNYQFNTIEAAFIIYKCYRLSIKEKHNAFLELMDSMSDMQLPDKLSYRLDDLDLFRCLKEKIRYESKMLEYIYNGKENMVYTYTLFEPISKRDRPSKSVFSSYQKAKDAAIADIEDELIIINAIEVDSDKVIRCYLNKGHEIGEIDARVEKYNDATCFLDDIWVYIPTPFEKGDLLYMPVTDIALSGIWSNVPMVLTSIDYWDKDEKHIEYRKKNGDSSDMTAFGFWMDSKDHIYDECCHAYQDLEYYRGKLIIKDNLRGNIRDFRLLKAISAYMKGKINEDMLLAANNLIKAEYTMQDSFPTWDYVEEWYKEAGISDIWEKRKLIEEYERGKI